MSPARGAEAIANCGPRARRRARIQMRSATRVGMGSSTATFPRQTIMVLSRSSAQEHKADAHREGILEHFPVDAPVRSSTTWTRRSFPLFPEYGFSLAEIWAMPPHFPYGDVPAADRIARRHGAARHPGGERSRPPVPGRPDVQEGPVVLPLLRGRGAPARVRRRRPRESRGVARAQRRGNGGPAHVVPGRTVVPAPVGRLSLLDERTRRRGRPPASGSPSRTPRSTPAR